MSRKKENADSPGRSTGPVTPEGKFASSQNATKHGARIERHVILPTESEEEYLALRQRWMDEYTPKDQLEQDLVDRVAQREWVFRRCERNLDEVHFKILTRTPDPTEWTEDDHKLIALFNRYHTKAERTWREAWRDIERLRRDRGNDVIREQVALRRLWENRRDGLLREPDPAAEKSQPRALSSHRQSAETIYEQPQLPLRPEPREPGRRTAFPAPAA